MSKPDSQQSILTWVLASVGFTLWAIGTMGWAPDTLLHPISYVLIFAAAAADSVVGREGASTLQLGYAVLAWLMVALIAVTEALSLGDIIFFSLIALLMTVLFFHPSFRLKTRVTLYFILLAVVWAPTLYGILSPESADGVLGAGIRPALTVEALVVSAIFFTFAIRWLTARKSGVQ